MKGRVVMGTVALLGVAVIGTLCAPKPRQDVQQGPATVEVVVSTDKGDSGAEQQFQQDSSIQDAETQEETQLRLANEYEQQYLLSLSQALLNTQAVNYSSHDCRMSDIYADAVRQRKETGKRVEDILIAKLDFIYRQAQERAKGLEAYSSDGEGIDQYQPDTRDAEALLDLLTRLTQKNPQIPICNIDPDSAWGTVNSFLHDGSKLIRNKNQAPRLVPVNANSQSQEREPGQLSATDQN